MKKTLIIVAAAIAAATSCKMENPFLTESTLPYGAPQFDKIQTAHYMPAFKQGIAEAKAEIDAVVASTETPTFANTVEAIERGGKTLNKVSSIFYNLMEADTNDELQALAEEISPMMTEFQMYVNLNDALFKKVKAVYDNRASFNLDEEQMRLLEDTYKGFVRGGALLSDEDKQTYSKYEEELSLLQLKFGKNALAATNAFKLNLTDEADLEGLPEFVREIGSSAAAELGQTGWTYDLTAPSYGPFMKYSARRDLRQKMYMAYNTKAVGGEFDNTEICRQIAELRIKIANILGYENYAEYVIEEHMAKSPAKVWEFLGELMEPSLPAAKAEVDEILAFAKENGFGEDELQPWDFSFWSEKLKAAKYSLSDEELKPYFQLQDCIDAVMGLATRLYGISFELRPDIPGYHKDVLVYDVKDESGKHLSLLYADFHPRASKRGGAWMTEFRAQSIDADGTENRPFISIVTNFSKPTASAPSLLTHDELTTFMHEFGHALHGMLAQGTYASQTGTSVDHDFVELPSQINENWAYEKEYLKPFAKHYKTGETIPDELIDKIVTTKNYLAAYSQVRQLQFGLLDMNWYTLTELPSEGTVDFETKVYAPTNVVPKVPGTCMSTTFSHIFTGGYAAGYYSYKWAEVLAADAFSLFKEKGVFNTEVSHSFRDNILSMGSRRDEGESYRIFRGHDPETKALLLDLGIIKQ